MQAQTPADYRIASLDVIAYTVPTSTPEESDGTAVWSSTTMVLVEITVGSIHGLGYTYANTATAEFIRASLADIVVGRDIRHHGALHAELTGSVRNMGRDGIAAMAVSAIDNALWDTRAKLAGLPLAAMLGMVRERVPVYGSGGFTSYTIDQLQHQLAGWIGEGIPQVKMKIGRDAGADLGRVAAARKAIGDGAKLFVDANGAYVRKEALRVADSIGAASGVSWFEEPVYHRDFEGLALVRDRAPAIMEISAGEYGYEPQWFRWLIERGCVDVVQADATRCGGFTNFLAADALCDASFVPLSSHCAPTLHVHVGCAAKRMRHIEYFHDHIRIERMFFDGVPAVVDGCMAPDLTRPGIGLELKRADAEPYRV